MNILRVISRASAKLRNLVRNKTGTSRKEGQAADEEKFRTNLHTHLGGRSRFKLLIDLPLFAFFRPFFVRAIELNSIKFSFYLTSCQGNCIAVCILFSAK